MFVHLIAGEAYGIRHRPGDPVSGKVPKRKLAEWLAAGLVEEVITEQEESDEDEFAGSDS